MYTSKDIFNVTKPLYDHISLKNIKEWYIRKAALSFPLKMCCEDQLHIFVTLENILPKQGVTVFMYSLRTQERVADRRHIHSKLAWVSKLKEAVKNFFPSSNCCHSSKTGHQLLTCARQGHISACSVCIWS